jgi:hypothetical protein
VHGGLTLAAFLTLAPIALAGAWVAAHYLPTDPASLGLSLTRSLWQISSGSILALPADNAGQALHPFNYGLLQVWALVLQPSLQALNFFNLIGWLAAGFAVHRLARVAGCGANSALTAGWCALLATPVLAQSQTVGPVLCTGATLVAAASFTLDWVKRGRLATAAFAGLLAGLAAGSHLAALLLVLALVTLGFVLGLPPRKDHGWKAALPGLGLGLLPYFLVNAPLLAEQGLGAWRLAWQQLAEKSTGLGVATLMPLWRTPDPLLAPNEDAVGLGWTGLVCVAAVALTFGRAGSYGRSAAWLGLPALAWLMACTMASHWIGLGSGALVPGLLLAAPCVALLIDRIKLPTRIWVLLGTGLALGSLWSTQLYLRHNAYRPLEPLLDSTLAGRQHAPLPPLLKQRLQEEPRLTLNANGDDLLLHALLGRPRPGRSVDEAGGKDTAYIVFARTAGAVFAREGGFATRPAYALIPFPEKPSAGVEHLGHMHLGSTQRGFFGLTADAARQASRPTDRALLAMIGPGPDPANPSQLQLEVIGLNPADQARLEAFAENEGGRRELLATFATGGSQLVTRSGTLQRVTWQLVSADDGRALSAVTLADTPSGPPQAPSLSANPHPSSGFELISAEDQPGVSCTGLLPAEGPFPQWNLPVIRWARDETVTLRVKAGPGTSTLRLGFSARLYVRRRAVLEIACNGTPVKTIAFNDPTTWQEQLIELPARAGENVIELRDRPLPPEPDWAGYLERYADVKRYVEMMRQPPFEGAREHYEQSGRAEGRIITMIRPPRPAPGTFYFMFRSLRVEEIQP